MLGNVHTTPDQVDWEYLDCGADCQPCVVQRLDLDKDWGGLGERRWRGCMGPGGEGKGREC